MDYKINLREMNIRETIRTANLILSAIDGKFTDNIFIETLVPLLKIKKEGLEKAVVDREENKAIKKSLKEADSQLCAIFKVFLDIVKIKKRFDFNQKVFTAASEIFEILRKYPAFIYKKSRTEKIIHIDLIIKDIDKIKKKKPIESADLKDFYIELKSKAKIFKELYYKQEKNLNISKNQTVESLTQDLKKYLFAAYIHIYHFAIFGSGEYLRVKERLDFELEKIISKIKKRRSPKKAQLTPERKLKASSKFKEKKRKN